LIQADAEGPEYHQIQQYEKENGKRKSKEGQEIAISYGSNHVRLVW
jgi:hypothetical protein